MNQLINLFANYGIYFFVALLAIDIALAVKIFLLRKRMKTIFRGDGGDLEKVLLDLRASEDKSQITFAELKNRIGVLEEALPKNICRVGLVRYNPFSDAGGDQSFALALLDEQKNGVVISSLYGREVNRVYAKSVQNGLSQHLTEEEKTAIKNAK